jgi:uncharacterized protein
LPAKIVKMRADFWFLYVFVALIFIADIVVYRRIGLLLAKRNKYIKIPFYTLFWSVPVFISAAFLYLFSMVKKTDNPDLYVWFSYLFGAFLIIYIPKLVFLVFSFGDAIRNMLLRLRDKLRPQHHPRKGEPITRAHFLGRVGLIAAAIPFTSMVYGMARGRFNFYVKHVPVAFDSLPDAFSGLKIIHISDIHLGNFNQQYHRLFPIIDMINDEQPDLILFTGDLVNNFGAETIGWSPVFSKLKARYGKYSILGNHDYGNYSRWPSPQDKQRNFQQILQAHERFGFKLLNNEHVRISHSGQTLVLAGVENWGKPPFPRYGDIEKTLDGVGADEFTVLMSHDPDHWEAEVVPRTNVDLTLSGHTHGMQMGISYKNLKWSPAGWKYKHWDGLYQQGERSLYVNRGLGFVGIPMRIGMPPEITLLELRKS